MTHDYTDERKKWGASVGHFILAFGDIENITYLVLRDLPKDKIFVSTSRLGFGNRVDLVIEIISAHSEVPEELREQFVSLLNAAKKLSDKRNTVAHAPLMMNFYEHQSEGWIHKEFGLASAKNPENSISYAMLCEMAHEAQNLASALYECFGKIFKCLHKK